MSHLLPCRLHSNLNAFFVYQSSNCLLALTPLAHGIVHRNFIFHERQNHAKSKKPEILKGFDGKTLLGMFISQARCNLNTKISKVWKPECSTPPDFFQVVENSCKGPGLLFLSLNLSSGSRENIQLEAYLFQDLQDHIFLSIPKQDEITHFYAWAPFITEKSKFEEEPPCRDESSSELWGEVICQRESFSNPPCLGNLSKLPQRNRGLDSTFSVWI